VITLFGPREWQKQKLEERERWWPEMGKESNCYQLNTNRIQPDYVKQWGRSAVQQKQPNHNILKIKIGLQNTFKVTHLDTTRGGKIKSMNSYRLHDQRWFLSFSYPKASGRWEDQFFTCKAIRVVMLSTHLHSMQGITSEFTKQFKVVTQTEELSLLYILNIGTNCHK
jgi:hypothetical protein